MKTLSLFFAFCIVIGFTNCKHKEEVKLVKNNFLVTNPIKMDTSLTKNYVCQIRSINHIEVKALEKGYLQDFFVDEGQPVKKGQVLFQIVPLLYQAEMHKAQAEAKFAEIEYRNTKRLADSGIVAPNELALSGAKLEKARAELQLTQVHLGFTKIVAPFDGIMGRLHVRKGSLLNEGDLLTTLSDNSTMWVYFNMPEHEYINYQTNKGQNTTKVGLRMANNEIFENAGKIEVIEADFNNETGNIAFRASFPNPSKLLRHGATGNIILTVPVKNALLIPQKATFEILDKRFVFVIDKDNTVKTREITVGAELEDLYVVNTGLKDSEQILLEGLRKVKENDVIAYKHEKSQDVIAGLKVYVE
jgi:membrane fusion protein (multidrug efflux system)